MDTFTREVRVVRNTATMSISPPALLIRIESNDETLIDFVNESYTLQSDETGVLISAATVYGVHYALDTLRQLTVGNASAHSAGTVHVKHAYVHDAPESLYRGLMLSPGQRFLPVLLVEQFLIGMATARMNVLHFHLSEFCRYALQSAAYPNLTVPLEAGVNRGYYTTKEIVGLVGYAKARGIRLMPEYDTPGHQSRNMGSQLPGLDWCANTPPTPSEYVWELRNSEENWKVVSQLYTEIADAFPAKLLHMGGDETSGGGLNRTCSLASVVAMESRVQNLIAHSLNKTAVGWAELLFVSNLSTVKDMILLAWELTHTQRTAKAVAKHGIKTVDACGEFYYFGAFDLFATAATYGRNNVYSGNIIFSRRSDNHRTESSSLTMCTVSF
jgi:hexosaminidase